MTWVIYSTRPLQIQELAVAIVIHPGVSFTLDQRLDFDEDILEICGSFVKLNAQTNCVELSHISVAEYFTSPELPDRTRNTEFIEEKVGHRLLLETCLTHLSSSPLDSGPCQSINEAMQRSKQKFLLYPAYTWPEHARKIKNEKEQSRILTFFSLPAYGSWSQIFEELDHETFRKTQEQRWGIWLRHQGNVPSLYYAAMFGLDQVVMSLIANGVDVNINGGEYGYPVLAAVQYARASTVQSC